MADATISNRIERDVEGFQITQVGQLFELGIRYGKICESRRPQPGKASQVRQKMPVISARSAIDFNQNYAVQKIDA